MAETISPHAPPTDERKHDGPFDKQMIRRNQKESVQFLKSDLYVRVPHGMPDEPTYGTMEEVEKGPFDMGRRWTHTYDKVKDSVPVSFDAGFRALWVSPLGWRVLENYVKDDPTYGFQATIFDPAGKVYATVEGETNLASWLDSTLP